MEETRKPTMFEIPETLREEAKNLVANAFRLFAEQSKGISDELDEFDRKREETRRRIRARSKRTTGRIV
jgi:hypothetical protein